MNEEQNELFTFPCHFPIKIVGEHGNDLDKFVMEILEEHVQNPKTIKLTTKDSSKGTYISVSASFEAHSKSQLDDIYQKITANKKVKFAL